MFVVPMAQHGRVPVPAHHRPTQSRGEGLTPLRGFPFAVLASEHAGAAATRIALRAQDACDLLRDVLGEAPHLSLRVLDRHSWAAHAEIASYGVTHVANNGDLVVGVTPADAWHGVSRYLARNLPGHELARLVDVHGADPGDPRGPALDALAESLIAHEVAHVLVDQQRIVFPSRWLEEAFANYVLVAVLGTNDPAGLRLLGSLAEAARALDAGMVLASFRSPGEFGGLAPLVDEAGKLDVNLDSYARFVTETVYLQVFVKSAWYAVLTTLICLLLAYPLATLIAKSPRKYRDLLLLLVILPFWSNFLIRVYAWMIILGPNAALARMSYYQHHVFFCCNQRDPPERCCATNDALAMQQYAKKRIKALGMSGKDRVRINKAGCLDRCEEGPVIVVYPEQVWYTYVDRQDIDEIIDRHLVAGEIVERLRI